MNGPTARALQAEAMKLARSRVGPVATGAIVLGTVALLTAVAAGVAGGRPELVAKAGPAAVPGWAGLLAGASQVAGVVTILGFGTVLGWLFGREFADGTVIGLFAQPVTRVQAALAKLAVFGVWGLAVSLALTGAVALLGFGLGYGALDDTTGAALGRLLALCVLSLGLAAPVAWIATLARSVLAAVGGTIALVVAAQVGVLAGAGGWMPFAAPGLWAISSGAAVTPLQLGLSVAVPCLSVPLVCVSWRGMQLDR